MRHFIKKARVIAAMVALLCMAPVGAGAFDAAGLFRDFGTWYYQRFLAPSNIFSDIKCDRCDMSTEWLQGADMSAFNNNEIAFLQLEKLLNRPMTSGDILELCNGSMCAVYVYTGKIAGTSPWILMKPAYKDVHTRYRNVSFVKENGKELQRSWITTYSPYYGPNQVFQKEGSVEFPREIYCPGPYCLSDGSGASSLADRFDYTDTIVTAFPAVAPSYGDTILLKSNTNDK